MPFLEHEPHEGRLVAVCPTHHKGVLNASPSCAEGELASVSPVLPVCLSRFLCHGVHHEPS